MAHPRSTKVSVKSQVIFWLIVFGILFYVGLKLAMAYEEGGFLDIGEYFGKQMLDPFHVEFTRTSGVFLLITLGIGGVCFASNTKYRGKYKHGREYGEEEEGDAREISRRLGG